MLSDVSANATYYIIPICWWWWLGDGDDDKTFITISVYVCIYDYVL